MWWVRERKRRIASFDHQFASSSRIESSILGICKDHSRCRTRYSRDFVSFFFRSAFDNVWSISFRSVPESYAVLFLQGGATAQFSAVPLNFLNLSESQTADYLVTGYWSEKAAKEAQKFGKINWVVPKREKYTGRGSVDGSDRVRTMVCCSSDVPAEETWKLTEKPSYFYYCANETIDGIELAEIPRCVPDNIPVICDMSSNFLTRPFDLSKVWFCFVQSLCSSSFHSPIVSVRYGLC